MSVLYPHPPERLVDQGIHPQQFDSCARALEILFHDPEIADQVDLVALYRRGPDEAPETGCYEVVGRRGLVRFQRVVTAGGALDYEILEVEGENPLEREDPLSIHTLEAERRAAVASGFAAEPWEARFIGPEQQSHPYGYERIAQLFDSPHAPDLAVSPMDWAFGTQPGMHGALNVRQSRAPLWLVGRRIRPGDHMLAARAIDIAPTVLAALDFPKIDGRDATGRLSSERGVGPDVYLARQDGRPLSEILDSDARPGRYLYLFLLDGLHPTALEQALDQIPERIPNLVWLRERAARIAGGSIVNFPSITWPSHTAIGTGTWCGHHDVVNPSYYLRQKKEMISPQGQQVHTEGFSNPEVESLYEVFTRVRGDDCMTAAIHAPFGRSARHAVLEGRNLPDHARLKALTGELRSMENPRWRESEFPGLAKESTLDSRGLAQVIELFESDELASPDFVYHELILTDGVGHDYGPHSEALFDALAENDARIGRVLDLLEKHGRLEDTVFIVTADHGMSPQNVELAANPVAHVERAGLACRIAEPMIWLLDLFVEADRAPDGRSGRVVVCELDRDPTGERPPVEGARVKVEAKGRVVAEGTTGPGGVFGFPTQADLEARDYRVTIEAEGFNARTVELLPG